MSMNPFSFFSRRHEAAPRPQPQRRELFHEPELRGSLVNNPGSHASSYSKESSSGMANVRVDWRETPEMHEYKVHLPGLRRDEVKVEVEDERVVCITGERTEEREEKTGKWTRLELHSGTFVQRFRLPENANPNHVKAYMENGVLTITVPKYEVARNYYSRPVNVYGH
ncbi:hypothetical protein L6164_003445 [Bauhinia variegata]|uniref:Uncharacterized protein n=1 Tax=Bauhinia variegata TaxID=167791 RepID=A0ACB9Q0V4_BAUVA|nr:hypothetical protein L6164_003445 [Bauhinia variegata]